jgi:hypothetical protein
VLDAKSQPSFDCPIFRQLVTFRADYAGTPPVSEWVANEQEDLAPPAFIRLKPSQSEFQKTWSTCGDVDAYSTIHLAKFQQTQ